MSEITLNEGAQTEFVTNDHRASGFIGGLGSGKTFAGLARALKFSQQPIAPNTRFGPRGCVAAINYPVLKDVVLPQFFEMMDGTGLWKTGTEKDSWVKSELKARLVAGCSCANKRTCKHETIILFRSLDKPNWMRGLELSWFFIDEGRHVGKNAWDVLWGRLRQRGYFHAGWVCSTPDGYNWMWQVLHPDSPTQLKDAIWYGAPTMDNQSHLPEEYVDSLFAMYEGRFLRQEVFGEFVGTVGSAVFYAFDPTTAVGEVPYDPDLPLYSMWDFGIGDLQVVSFGQIEMAEKALVNGQVEYVPRARLIGTIEASDRTSSEWAQAVKDYCAINFSGRMPDMNIGDPAGMQRNSQGTSYIQDAAKEGIIIAPAPKKPPDYAVRILNNMMEGGRVIVDAKRAARLAAALASHKWPTDPDGNRTGNKPVHDWTSHYCDGVRYWATVCFGLFPQRTPEPRKPEPPPGTFGHLEQQLLRQNTDKWLGAPRKPKLDWNPGPIRVE